MVCKLMNIAQSNVVVVFLKHTNERFYWYIGLSVFVIHVSSCKDNLFSFSSNEGAINQKGEGRIYMYL